MRIYNSRQHRKGGEIYDACIYIVEESLLGFETIIILQLLYENIMALNECLRLIRLRFR